MYQPQLLEEKLCLLGLSKELLCSLFPWKGLFLPDGGRSRAVVIVAGVEHQMDSKALPYLRKREREIWDYVHKI